MTAKQDINQVRKIVRERLGQLSRSAGVFQETYLFHDEKFDGIRFSQSYFSAVWRLGEFTVAVKRDQQQVLLINLASQQRKQAA